MGIFRQSLGLEALSDSGPNTRYGALRVPTRSSAKPVTLDTVVGLDGVFRAIQLITTMGAATPFHSWRGAELVERQPRVVAKPDPWRSARSWKVRALTSAVVDGNIYLRHHPDVLDGKTIVAAPVLNPFGVEPDHDRSGRKVFRYLDDFGRTETLSAEEVSHIWLNEFPGFKKGLSPITACRIMLGGAVDIRDYAGKFFDAVPPGTLTSDQPVTEPQATEAQNRWTAGEKGRIRVLGRGLKFEPMLINAKDAQWIEAQRFTVLQVARMFGVPAVRLAAAIEGSSLTYENLRDVNQDYVDTTLDPVYIGPLCDAVTELTAAGQETRPDYSRLLQGDEKYQIENHAAAITAGIYDANHARRRMNIAGPAPRKPRQEPAA